MGIELDTNLIRESIAKGKRFDGRDFEAYRDVSVETGVVTSAEGSAIAKIGNTQIICGIKMSVGTPYPDTPAEGVMSVSGEFVRLANPDFERGKPSDEAIEMARVVDRAIRESRAIDFGKLCIEPEKAVWMVYIDLDVLNDEGNLIDTACLAAASALATTKLPVVIHEGENYKTDFGNKSDESIPMNGIPVNTTFVKIGDKIMADPSYEEFMALDARLTVGTINKDGKTVLCSMQKGGRVGLSVEETEKIIDLAQQHGDELREKVKALVK